MRGPSQRRIAIRTAVRRGETHTQQPARDKSKPKKTQTTSLRGNDIILIGISKGLHCRSELMRFCGMFAPGRNLSSYSGPAQAAKYGLWTEAYRLTYRGRQEVDDLSLSPSLKAAAGLSAVHAVTEGTIAHDVAPPAPAAKPSHSPATQSMAEVVWVAADVDEPTRFRILEGVRPRHAPEACNWTFDVSDTMRVVVCDGTKYTISIGGVSVEALRTPHAQAAAAFVTNIARHFADVWMCAPVQRSTPATLHTLRDGVPTIVDIGARQLLWSTRPPPAVEIGGDRTIPKLDECVRVADRGVRRVIRLCRDSFYVSSPVCTNVSDDNEPIRYSSNAWSRVSTVDLIGLPPGLVIAHDHKVIDEVAKRVEEQPSIVDAVVDAKGRTLLDVAKDQNNMVPVLRDGRTKQSWAEICHTHSPVELNAACGIVGEITTLCDVNGLAPEHVLDDLGRDNLTAAASLTLRFFLHRYPDPGAHLSLDDLRTRCCDDLVSLRRARLSLLTCIADL